jgi:WD40 repeat protein
MLGNLNKNKRNLILTTKDKDFHKNSMLYNAVFLKTKPEVYLGITNNSFITMYNYETKVSTKIEKITCTVYAIEVTPDEKFVLCSGTNKNIFIICTVSHRFLYSIDTNHYNNYGIQVTSDSKYFFCVNADYLKKFNLKTKKEIFKIKGLKPSEKKCLVLSKNNKRIYGTGNQFAAVVLLNKGFKITPLNKESSIRCNELSGNESLFLSGCRSGKLVISNSNSKKILHHNTCKSSGITSIRFYKDLAFCSHYSGQINVHVMEYPFSRIYTHKMGGNIFGMDIHHKKGLLCAGGQNIKDTEILNINYTKK